MGRLVLVLRLAVRDLRRRPLEAVMVLLMVTASATTLTVGLALAGVTNAPYRQTRAATAGPDVVAGFLREDGAPLDPAAVDALLHTPGVTAHSGPYPLVNTVIKAGGRSVVVDAVGRDTTPADVDQPALAEGAWVRDGQVVLERGFAAALGVHTGDRVVLGDREFRVAGTATTAALPAYPSGLCHIICFVSDESTAPAEGAPDRGLVWLTKADVAALTRPGALTVHLVNLRLADPAAASAFAGAHDTRPGPGVTAPFMFSWQSVRDADSGLVRTAQTALLVGGVLLALIAVAGLSVLAGRRMVEQTRRVGLLKAVGGTPGLVTAVLLVEHLALSLLAATVGLVIGRLLAPTFSGAGAGLVGAPGTPSLTASTAGLVITLAVAVAVAATLLPALRAARSSTVRALNDPSRTPRRSAGMVAASAWLPLPLLLGLRLIAGRPARAVLNGLNALVTVTGIVTILTSATAVSRAGAGAHNLRVERLGQVTTTITVMLLIAAAVNTVFMTWATATDARRTSAVSRAFGATSAQIATGLSTAQLLPALLGALVGLPAGIFLYRMVTQEKLAVPPVWQLLAVLLGTTVAITALAALPARLGAGRSVAAVLQADTR
jgi:ABC-type lipoprotein release transport system permease subunit